MTHPSIRSKLAANPSVRHILAFTVAFGVGSSIACAAHTSPAANPQAAELKGFEDRIRQFVALKKKLETQLPEPPPSSDREKIEARQKAFTAAMIAARRDALQGDVFGDAAAQVRHTIRVDARRRTARDAYATMIEVPRQQRVRVNTEYPKDQPRATLPPLILARLPPLPEGLEYRFMGRDLILHDAASNLIIDFIHEAVPTIGR